MADEERAQVSELRAIAHPVRLRMLSLLTGTAMSAADLARELGTTHANASYHLRQLAAAGAVVEAGEQRIRGGTAKLYRYPVDPDRRVGPSPTHEERVAYARALFREVERREGDRRRGGVRGQSSDLEGWVPEGTWLRAVGLVEEASRLLHDANRPPRTPGTVPVSFTTYLFALTGTADDGATGDTP